MKTRSKILCILICLIIIIAGIVTWKSNGFNLELQYSNRNQISISNNKGINKSDVEQIATEVLGETRHFVQEIETFGNAISIIADEITDEQKDKIIEKFNEKYETKIKAKDIQVVSIPFTRVKDVIRPFIIPGIITVVIVSLYFLIRFKEFGWKTILLNTVIIPIIAELILYSVIAITKIPFGRVAIACGIGLYVIIIAILTNIFENQKENNKEDKKDK